MNKYDVKIHSCDSATYFLQTVLARNKREIEEYYGKRGCSTMEIKLIDSNIDVEKERLCVKL